MIRNDVEYLKNLPKDWWQSPNTVITVGRILDGYGYIVSIWNFVERPKNYQTLIDEFVEEWKDA